GNDIQAQRVVWAGADEAVVGRGDRGIDPTERGLMRIIEGDLFVARAEEGSPIAGLVAMGCGERDGPLPRHREIGWGGMLGRGAERSTPNEPCTQTPCQRAELARHHRPCTLSGPVPSERCPCLMATAARPGPGRPRCKGLLRVFPWACAYQRPMRASLSQEPEVSQTCTQRQSRSRSSDSAIGGMPILGV